MAICPEQGADLHMAQLMPLPLAVSKIQIGFIFLVLAHPGGPGQTRVCVRIDGQHQDVDRTPRERVNQNDRDKWRKYVHGVTDPWIDDG